jgi:CubicO group peptidase (beta-lactamase class C family)
MLQLLRIPGLAACALVLASLPPARSDVRDVSAVLVPIRAKNDVPGLAAAVVRGGELVALGADGVRKRGSEVRITAQDRFHMGSCTKSMTATMLATLVEEGKLRWTTTVGEVFGPLVATMRPAWKDVTLEQLVTHRAGAPAGLDAGGLWGRLWKREGTPREQRMTLVRGVLEREPEAPPGTKFMYSNAGFAVAGAMAETVTNKAWEELMEERVFTPLAMKSAGFGAPGTAGKLDEPLGHGANGEAVEVGPGADNPPAIGPAGTVHLTLADWAKYVAFHLEGDRCADGKHPCPETSGALKGLKPATFAKLHAPAPGEGASYAMGWGIAERDWAHGRVLTHNGSNTMWFCVTWIAPERDFAVLVATNQGGDAAAKACDEAASALIREMKDDDGKR